MLIKFQGILNKNSQKNIYFFQSQQKGKNYLFDLYKIGRLLGENGSLRFKARLESFWFVFLKMLLFAFICFII